MIVPASVLGRGGRPAPSERVNVACIGFGTVAMTTTLACLNEKRAQVVSIADVNKESGHCWYNGRKQGGREAGRRMADEHYAKQTGQAGYRGCTASEDFREMLDREDIDAVNISTPDHWHGQMAIYCARKGKHISIRLGRHFLKWDPQSETIPEDADAARMLSRPVRKERVLVS